MVEKRQQAKSQEVLDYVDIDGFNSAIERLSSQQKRTMQNYLDEAIFFAPIILSELEEKPSNAHILEIGSGVGWLTNYFHTIGYEISAIEPAEAGFGEMFMFQEIVRQVWKGKIPRNVINATAENFGLAKKADFAFSINVMEHVSDIQQSIINVMMNLKTNSEFRFICPNYAFPYEPHFGFLTIYNKKLTNILWKRRISTNELNQDGQLWEGLNWITPNKIETKLTKQFKIEFSKRAFEAYLLRIVGSSHFRNRKGFIFNLLADFVYRFRRIFLIFLPATKCPVLDVKITSISS